MDRTYFIKELQEGLEANNLQSLPLSKEALADYIDELLDWNGKINLTAHQFEGDLIEKDILDILYLATYIQKQGLSYKQSLDMGAGAGFGGLILALLHPNSAHFFLESNRRKINFIRQAGRRLGLKNLQFLNCRAEEVPSTAAQSFDLVFSRATWNLPNFLKHSIPYAASNGTLLLMSGPQQEPSENIIKNYPEIKYIETFPYEIRPRGYQRKVFKFEVHF